MSNLVGAQTQWDSAEMLLYLEIVGPRYCMGINVVKRDYLEKVRARGAKYIYRHHPNFDEAGLAPWFTDPELAAQEAAAFLRGHLSALDLVDYVTDGNEYILGPDHETPERIALADRYMAAFIKAARLFLSKGAIVGNFNTGHWRREGELVEYFPLMLQALQEDCEENPEDGAKIGWHEYNWPLLRDDSYWRTATFLRAMPAIIERYPLARCLITELGIDRAAAEWGVGHEGFRKAHPNIDVAIDMFCGGDGLAWYVDRLLEAPYVDGVLLFGCGMTDWRRMGFDVINDPDDVAVPNRISLLPDAAPPEPPEPPPNGGNDVIKVVDMDYGEQSEQWAKDKYGIDWDFAPVSDGWVWRLVELWEKTGTTSHITQVLDKNYQPVPNKIVTFYWSGAEESNIANELDWHSNYVYGLTNENGEVGPGMGIGAYHGEGEGGPHEVWVHDDYIKSDRLRKIGMLAGTFHDHLDCKFKLMYIGEQPPEPPENGTLDRILAMVEATKDDTSEILHILKPDDEPPPPPPEIFTVRFYNGIDLGDPIVYEMTQGQPFWNNWGAEGPGHGVTPDYFSGSWTGIFSFEAKVYTFNVRVDDGARLYIDDVLVLDVWRDQSATTYSVQVLMAAGPHKVVVKYYEKAGDAILHVNWV